VLKELIIDGRTVDLTASGEIDLVSQRSTSSPCRPFQNRGCYCEDHPSAGLRLRREPRQRTGRCDR